jgi:hypothetical protein
VPFRKRERRAQDVSRVVSRGASAVSGMLGGAIAGVIFKQVWKLASGKDDAPQATSDEYGWGEILVASAIQGAIFGVVKAAIDRSAARSIHRATGK